MRWSDIPTSAKMTAAVVTGVIAVMGYLSTYQTDAEAQAYQQQHQTEIARFRVQQLEQQIAQYRYQLLSADLTPQQREWITAEIERLEALKRCINSGGKC